MSLSTSENIELKMMKLVITKVLYN